MVLCYVSVTIASKPQRVGAWEHSTEREVAERTSEVRLHDAGPPAGHLADVAALDEHDVHDVVPDMSFALHLLIANTYTKTLTMRNITQIRLLTNTTRIKLSH